MELNENLLRFMQIMRKFDNLDFFPGMTKLSKTEFRILREILFEEEKQKYIISSELARRLGVTRSAISQIVNKMEERGTVKRVPSATDKKIAYIQLSENAIAVFDEQCRKANTFFEEVVQEFGKEKIKSFVASCETFAKAVKTVQGRHKSEKKD